MKKYAKVFIWIGMIMRLGLIYPFIVGLFALKKIKEAKSKNELQVFAILTVFLCSILGGLFMLCIKDEELLPFDNFKNVKRIKFDKIKK